MSVLHIWTVYEHPRDFPHSYVARRFDVGPAGAVSTGDLVVAPDLESIRQQLPEGVVRMDRSPTNDPHVLESWL